MANLGRDGRYPSFAVGEEEDGRRAQEMTQQQPSSGGCVWTPWLWFGMRGCAISRGCSSHSSHANDVARRRLKRRFCFGGVLSRVDGARTPGRTGVLMELVRQEELAFVGGSKKFDFWSMDLVLVRGLRSCFFVDWARSWGSMDLSFVC